MLIRLFISFKSPIGCSFVLSLSWDDNAIDHSDAHLDHSGDHLDHSGDDDHININGQNLDQSDQHGLGHCDDHGLDNWEHHDHCFRNQTT